MSERSTRLRFTRAEPEPESGGAKARRPMPRKKQFTAPPRTAGSGRGAARLQPVLPAELAAAETHRALREDADDSTAAESADCLTQTGAADLRAGRQISRPNQRGPERSSNQLAGKSRAGQKQAASDAAASGGANARAQQRRGIKKSYAAERTRRQRAESAAASVRTEKKAERTERRARAAGDFISRHKKGFLIFVALAVTVVLLLNLVSSLSVLMHGTASGLGVSTYPSADEDMLAAEAQYAALEADLQTELDSYPARHPGYDEYRYVLDSIEHDPYVLVSLLTAMRGGAWTITDVQDAITELFARQYALTQMITTETRTRTVANPDGTSGTETYTVTICNVKLVNNNLSHLPVDVLSEDRLSLYSIYMATLGNRPDLFPDSAYIGKYITNKDPAYEIPPEALSDDKFAAIIREAEKYLGYPYVWGGASPATSFDCSGFVSWVINHSGWNVGRLTTDGLFAICTPVSPERAKPGDLIFFVGTYKTPGTSHVGIYVGNNMMIHCGDPIKYASIDTSYWRQHFYSFARLPGN